MLKMRNSQYEKELLFKILLIALAGAMCLALPIPQLPWLIGGIYTRLSILRLSAYVVFSVFFFHLVYILQFDVLA